MGALQQLLTKLYQEDASGVLKAFQNTLSSSALPIEKQNGEYRQLQLYVAYPDTFHTNGKKASLYTLADNLDYIANLGMNGIHVLPFFDSPMIDMGFDVRDYLTIREDLGGNEAFEEVLEKAGKLDLNIFVDMVLNHTSNQHKWFQQAVAGDEFYRHFYVHLKEKPTLLEEFTDDMGIWAVYEIDGIPVKARVIFPEQAGELPHWIQGEDGYWYYHTFYPHQPDLDWTNPDVFTAFSKILIYWAKKGLHFRLDAVPFVGKRVKEAVTEADEQGHVVLQALHALLEHVGSKSTFLVEACQPLNVTKRYFGTGEAVQAEFAYNFELMRALWASLVAEHPEHIWEALDNTTPLPAWGQWITFLRNHDELTLEFADPDVRTLIYTSLHKKGLPFREAFGIAGRTIELLDNDPWKLVMAYFLLASLPGSPAVIYGDEIGKPNDLNHMQEQLEHKRALNGFGVAPDTRDANRGSITEADLEREGASYIYEELARIFSTRKRVPGLAVTVPTKLDLKDIGVFAAEYDLGEDRLTVLVNLSKREKALSGMAGEAVLSVNRAQATKDEVTLPAYGGIWLRRAKSDMVD